MQKTSTRRRLTLGLLAVMILSSCQSPSTRRTENYKTSDACEFVKGRLPSWGGLQVGSSVVFSDTKRVEDEDQLQSLNLVLQRVAQSHYYFEGTNYLSDVANSDSKIVDRHFKFVITAGSITGSSESGDVTIPESRRETFIENVMAQFVHGVSCTAATVSESGRELKIELMNSDEYASLLVTP